MSTNYGRVKSDHGNLSYDGVGIDAWDFNTAGSALQDMQNNNTGTSNWKTDLADVQAQYNVLSASARYEELLGALSESMMAAAEAASTSEPAQEALKSASDQASNASSETGRKQQLRSGLLSLYNRYGSSGGTSSISSKASVLGG